MKRKIYHDANRTYKLIGYALSAVIVVAMLMVIVWVVCEAC